MGRGERATILHILEILWKYSDEEHPIPANQITEKLMARGISCNRKAIYPYLDSLETFGLDIIRTQKGAYLGMRPFELAELRMMVDAIYSLRFISKEQSEKLVEKMGGLISEGQNAEFKKLVGTNVSKKNKTEHIYYNVDCIHDAMKQDVKIGFYYWMWNEKKEKVKKKDGEQYVVSPWKLMIENDKYYLIAYDEDAKRMKHYRVDRMTDVHLCFDKRQGKELYAGTNFSVYGVENFNMFCGKHETVTLRATHDMAAVMIDRFGKDVWMHTEDADCVVVVDVYVSNQFFGWITGLGGKVRIDGPVWVKDAYEELLRDILKGEG